MLLSIRALYSSGIIFSPQKRRVGTMRQQQSIVATHFVHRQEVDDAPAHTTACIPFPHAGTNPPFDKHIQQAVRPPTPGRQE